jgi:hypothetical protein
MPLDDLTQSMPVPGKPAIKKSSSKKDKIVINPVVADLVRENQLDKKVVTDRHRKRVANQLNKVRIRLKKIRSRSKLKEEIGFEEFSSIADIVEQSLITQQEEASLLFKAIESGISIHALKEVFRRGLNDVRENKTPQQVAFDRVNSFINGGHATHLDSDIFESLDENLRDWFKDKWVRMDTKGNIKGPCAREDGEGKPKCLPLAKARAMDKDKRAAAVKRKRREDPNPERSGAAINVRTEEKDACYQKVKSRYKVWPSAYASGALSKCRKVGAANWGNEKELEEMSNDEGIGNQGGRLDEVSKETKMRYTAKAAASTHKPKEGESLDGYLNRLHKRMSGIKKALKSTNPSDRFQKEEVSIPDKTTMKLKKIIKQLQKSVKTHHKQSVALKKLVDQDKPDVNEQKNCGCGEIPCITYGNSNENFMDGRNPQDKGDMARHGLKGKTLGQLKDMLSSDSASPRKKQLAHWYINMHKKT